MASREQQSSDPSIELKSGWDYLQPTSFLFSAAGNRIAMPGDPPIAVDKPKIHQVLPIRKP